MSILGDARKRLQNAGVLKAQTNLNDYYTSLPGTRAHADYATREGLGQPIDNFGNVIGPSDGVAHTPYTPTCPTGYTYNPQTNSCDPDVVTPATPRPVPPIDNNDSDNNRNWHNDPNVFDTTTTSGYVDTKEVPQQVMSDLHMAYQYAGPGTPEEKAYKDAKAKNEVARAKNALKSLGTFVTKGPLATVIQELAKKGMSWKDIVNNVKGGVSNAFAPEKTYEPSYTAGEDLGSAAGAVGSSGDLGQQSYISYDNGNASDSNDDSGLSSSSDSFSESSGTDTGSTDVGGWTNKGGIIKARYNNQGGFPGGPLGTDTVPTWLTPDEFVIDRDSTQSKLPMHVKEQLMHANTGGEAAKIINDYEPDGGYEGTLKDLDELINKVGFATGRSV